jgi:predicted O-methyltransferase YrrM
MDSMIAKAAFAGRYLRYWWQAGTAHGLHAPFVYDLYTLVVRHTGVYQAYAAVEARRTALLADNRQLDVRDFGAGSQQARTGGRTRAVRAIARSAAKPPKYGQLLFRLVNDRQPRRILELGTSLGLTTAYLASADSRARVVTLEGDPASAAIARETFQTLELTNIKLLEGEFSQTLDEAIRQLGGTLDFVFFDGNHRYEPTLDYVKRCLPHRHAETVFVLDDIHWSADMERAWAAVKELPEVSLTIDLFAVGLVFFRPNAPKQHFILDVG